MKTFKKAFIIRGLVAVDEQTLGRYLDVFQYCALQDLRTQTHTLATLVHSADVLVASI